MAAAYHLAFFMSAPGYGWSIFGLVVCIFFVSVSTSNTIIAWLFALVQALKYFITLGPLSTRSDSHVNSSVWSLKALKSFFSVYGR